MFGPIPGENLLSDKTNQPWHQPPEFTDINEALDKVMVKMTEPTTARTLLSMVQVGFPLYRIGALVVMEGVAAGKWTVDMALLLVGPVTKIIEIMAQSYDLEYNLGTEDPEDNRPTGLFVKQKYERQKALKTKNLVNIVAKSLPDIKDDAANQEQPAAEGEGTAAPEAPEEDIQTQGFAQMNKPTVSGGM